jgi:hypothetical protein
MSTQTERKTGPNIIQLATPDECVLSKCPLTQAISAFRTTGNLEDALGVCLERGLRTPRISRDVPTQALNGFRMACPQTLGEFPCPGEISILDSQYLAEQENKRKTATKAS